MDKVESIEFDNFIDSNAELLLPEIHKSLQDEVLNSNANQAAVEEVEKILKTLESVK